MQPPVLDLLVADFRIQLNFLLRWVAGETEKILADHATTRKVSLCIQQMHGPTALVSTRLGGMGQAARWEFTTIQLTWHELCFVFWSKE